jgi:EAL domain-containing protein (putative c-di-GMP-specific phosphodiesterase class I)
VRDTIKEHGLPAGCLTLELTENTLMQRIDGALPALTSLRRSGVGVMMTEDIETAEQRARPKQAG